MSVLTSFVNCEPIQAAIMNMFYGQTNIKRYTPANITRFLLSDVNTDGVLKQTMAPNGKLRTVRIVYPQRFTPSDANATAAAHCETGTPRGETSKDYQLDPNVGVHQTLKVSVDDLRYRCESDELYVARTVLELMDNAIALAEQEFADKLALNLGFFATDADAIPPNPGANTEKTVYFRSSTGVLLNDAFRTITFDARAEQLPMPVVFGYENWWGYAQNVGAACCNEQGIDVSLYAQNNPFRFAESREAMIALGDPKAALSLSPGAVQVIWANRYENPLINISQGTLTQDTLLHPELPITFDYKVKYDDCENEFDITVSWNADLAFQPEDMYQATDRLFGTNGIHKYIGEDCYQPCS